MVERHVYKPTPRAAAETMLGSRMAPATNAPEPERAKTPALPQLVGLFALLLSLIPVCLGIYEFVGVHKPSNLPLAAFDALFRKFGSLLPFIPLVVRCMAQSQAQLASQAVLPSFVACLPSCALQAAIQGVRLACYGVHQIIQQRGVIAKDLLADHCVLGIAVQVGLALEIAAAMYLIAVSSGKLTAIMSTVSASTAWILLVLVSFDMRDTAKYFHHTQESVIGVVTGVVLFGLPASWLLLMPVSQRSSNRAQDAKKSR